MSTDLEPREGMRTITGGQSYAFVQQSDGWLLPEARCLADQHDEPAREPQPVASVLGLRFLDWQLEQTREESWAECKRPARALGREPMENGG